MTGFSGSYPPDDVHILLKRLPLQAFVNVAEKEALIQSGKKHYSEMLSPESLPSARYLDLFRHAWLSNRSKMARDCLVLADLIARSRQKEITIVSLARAGTPIGVILKRVLHRVFDRNSTHYSVSIIRDRGIDEVALKYILDCGHAPESIVFVDGWTGKGVIARELYYWVTKFNQKHGTSIDKGLYVLSDLAGTAAHASSSVDYLIPSSILNATVSGLISRSILNDAIGPGDFHGCVYFEEFEAHDQSKAFANDIVEAAIDMGRDPARTTADPPDRRTAAAVSRHCIQALQQSYGIEDPNLIKPGIGEATRVLLRRMPRLLILRDPDAHDVAHLTVLASEKAIPVTVDTNLPYQAVALIRNTSDG
jgi:hypothetical protein